MVYAIVSFANLAKVVGVSAEGDSEATESNSYLRPLEPLGSIVVLLSVPSQASSAVIKRAKMPAATGKSPRTRKKLAPGSSEIKLIVPLASSSLASLPYRPRLSLLRLAEPKGLRCLRSIASSANDLGDLDNDGSQVALTNRINSAEVASL